MLKREFKVNFKSFIIYLSILIIMFLFVYLIYPYIVTDEALKSMDEMMKTMPPEMLKAFNIDIASVDTAYGWLKTEGFMFILIIIGIFSAMLGSNIILKEENDKTIEYLGTMPITRNKILTNKVIVSITYIVLMVVILGLFNYVSLLLSGDFDQKQFILLSITPLLAALPLFAINLFISMFIHKTRKTIAISFGMVFIFYILSILSELSTKVEFIKYFSIYTLCDIRNVISKVSINPLTILISLIITIVFICLSYIRYNKKELI
ncbi:MAG: ABC transporter permease subunit [Bacilli bacterium]|nr:ABC transporter permease subunit [Bacilli bacterium]